MILNTKELQQACAKILTAIDKENNSITNLAGILELKTIDNILYLNITNKEYYVKITLGECQENFHATVNADRILKLVARSTSETIEFKVTDTTLIFTGTGFSYNFPLIYENDSILELPKIIIENPTVNFNIDSDILNSVRINNYKELSKVSKSVRALIKDVQKMYYIDEEGAITFTTGACVNKFTLEKPVKMLLNSNLVKLFSLFKNTMVDFTLGYDDIGGGMLQTKVCFKTPDIEITAILNCNDTLIKSMPAQQIRNAAFMDYEYSIVIDRLKFLQTIERLSIVTENETSNIYKNRGIFVFSKGSCTISDYTKNDYEEIKYANELPFDLNYEALFDLNDIKLALDSNQDQYITLNFSTDSPLVIAKDNIYTVIPKMVVQK